jgi:type 1 glutamine amidotransferase
MEFGERRTSIHEFSKQNALRWLIASALCATHYFPTLAMKKLLLLSLLACSVVAAEAADKKRVIVCTVTTGFRHSSIPYAEKTLEKLAAESGAYEIVDFARQPDAKAPQKPSAPKKPSDLPANADDKAKAKYEADLKKFAEAEVKYQAELAKWTPEMDAKVKSAKEEEAAQMKASMAKLDPKNLVAQKIDMVIFANTTGDLPLPDKEGFIKWIEDGHAFCAMHSGSDTFHGFKGYNDMLQGEFKTHGAQVPADLVAGDKNHPANAGIGGNWNIALEEVYEFKDTSQDRAKVRALWYLAHHPQKRDQLGYNAVSWCRVAGKGRVFYTSLGHREDLWSDDPALPGRKNSVEIAKQYQAHILGGMKWALGLVDGSAEPNPEVGK